LLQRQWIHKILFGKLNILFAGYTFFKLVWIGIFNDQ
jgi:hypothetical protein